jgi:C4-dicarboxylate-specific signal transduction histidine kinase
VNSDELAFFGKISAGVTHELKNVLAVINESNGLMKDLLSMLKDTPFPYREKFDRSIRKIEEQVQRGVEITTGFNRFSHSMDYPSVDVDLNSIVTLTISLARRFAALLNVELRGILCERPIMLLTNPFSLQMALTRAIEAFIKCMNGSGSILITLTMDTGTARLVYYFEGESGQRVKKGSVEGFVEWDEFEELASMLNIRYEWRSLDGGFALFF